MEKYRKIEAIAPTRIDLAGGTVDIWPIFLYLENPVTINMGINLYANAKLTESPAKETPLITLRSLDQNATYQFTWEKRDRKDVPRSLILPYLVFQYFRKRLEMENRKFQKLNLTIETTCKSPAGAGLGGSSSLAIALAGLFFEWCYPGKIDTKKDGQTLINIVKDIEAQVIEVPTGLQDYYGATFGGLQKIDWNVESPVSNALPEDTLQALQNRIVLFYSGKSRHSGINNWELFKEFIDHKGIVREQFSGIVESTRLVFQHLLNNDWEGVGVSIESEWKVRRQLSNGITTPEIDHGIQMAKKAGATAAKICGAGGGGCFFAYFPNGTPETRSAIIRTVESDLIKHLPFECVPKGLVVKSES